MSIESPYMTFYMMATVIFAISVIVCEIFVYTEGNTYTFTHRARNKSDDYGKNEPSRFV